MPKYAPRISEEQRAAIVSYALQPGSSAKAAQRAAIAGELAGGPFEISYSRVAELVKIEREHRSGEKAQKIARKGAARAVDEMIGELLNVTHREVRQLRNRPSNQPVDTERVRRCARALREIRLAAATVPNDGGKGAGKDPAGGQEEGKSAPSLLEQLAADGEPSTSSPTSGEETTQAGAASEDTQQETEEGTEEETPRATGQEENNAGMAGTAVCSSARDSAAIPASGLLV